MKAKTTPKKVQSPRLQTLYFVKSLYAIVQTEENTAVELLPKVKARVKAKAGETDNRLCAEMMLWLVEYERHSSRLLRLLSDLGGVAERESRFSAGAKRLGLALRTLPSSGTPQLVALLQKQNAIAQDASIRLLREYENCPISEESLRTARDLIALEEKIAKTLKTFL